MRKLILAVVGSLTFNPQPVVADWGDNWGQMVWGIDAFLVPLLSPWVWVALAAGLALIGVLALRTLGRPSWPATLGVALLAILPLIAVAQSVNVPHTFQNGTTADAIEVNENFETLIAELEDLRLRVSELEAQLLTPNACGGTVTLAHEPGDSCGSCGIDQFVCDGTESTICDGDTPGNNCGGCSTLAPPPGMACGACLLDTVVCSGTENAVCSGNTATNACGGCSTLAPPPGMACGACLLDTVVCSGTENTVCSGNTTTNACGGCTTLADPPGMACGFCGEGTRVCNGTEDTTCQGGSPGPTCP